MRCQRLDIDNLHVFLDRRRAPIVAEEFVTEKDIETGQPELRLALDSTRIRLAHLSIKRRLSQSAVPGQLSFASPSVLLIPGGRPCGYRTSAAMVETAGH